MKTSLLPLAVLLVVPFLPAGLSARSVFAHDGLAVDLDDAGHITVSQNGEKKLEIDSFAFNFTDPKSVTVGATGGDHAELNLVYPGPARYRDDRADLPVKVEISAVPGGLRFHAEPEWAQNITVHLADLGEHFFGILEPLYPNNNHGSDLRGEVVDVEAIGDSSLYHENYASVWSAFYMTNHGYASFFDTFARGRYHLGVGGKTELFHRTGKLDWYVFFGDNGDAILRSYFALIGSPKYVPVWACGPVGWRDQNDGGAPEILNDIEKMTSMKIPFTAWFVDRPYSEGANEWSKMNFSATFAHPENWIRTIREKYGLEFMTWIAPMTFGDKDFPGLLPSDVGYIDLTNPAALQEFERRLKTFQYDVGVKGHKMDRAEEFFPVMAQWSDGSRADDTRNKYLYLYAKVTDQFLRHAWGRDQFNFARGAYQRAQPYLSAIWGGDSRSSWDGLAGNLANAMRCGYMGFPVWGSDTGGYLGGRISEELYARWLEWSVWCGLFEIKLDNAGGRPQDRPPWVYSEQLQNIFRAACSLRMKLLPYVYSGANNSAAGGVMMKPLAYAYPSDEHTYGIWDEYLFGDAFLIAPITAPGGERQVYLPAGTWYDYHDLSKRYDGGKTVDVSVPMDRIPVFVKKNSIAIYGNIWSGNAKNWMPDADKNRVVLVDVFPGNDGESCSFTYVDSMDGDHGKSITAGWQSGVIVIKVPALSTAGAVRVKTDGVPAQVTIGGAAAKPAYDASSGQITLPPFAAGAAQEIRIRLR